VRRVTGRIPIVALVLAILGTGCGPAALQGLDEPTGPPLPSMSFQEETAAARTDTIGPDGGSIAVRSRTGVTFSLTVPEAALLSDVDITVTPIERAAVDGADAPDLVGVRLDPEGLNFLDWVTLEITGLEHDGDPIGVTSTAAGSNVRPIPATVTGDGVTLSTTHFSILGTSKKIPFTDLADRYAGSGFEVAYEAAMAFSGQTLTSVAETSLRAWITATEQALRAANSFGEFERATRETAALVLHLRAVVDGTITATAQQASDMQQALTGLLDTWFQEINRSVEHLHTLCVQDKDPVAGVMIIRWISLGFHLLWSAGEPRSLDRERPWRQKATACLTFELAWRVDLTATDPGGRTFTGSTDLFARPFSEERPLELALDPDQLTIFGRGEWAPSEWGLVDGQNTGCDEVQGVAGAVEAVLLPEIPNVGNPTDIHIDRVWVDLSLTKFRLECPGLVDAIGSSDATNWAHLYTDLIDQAAARSETMSGCCRWTRVPVLSQEDRFAEQRTSQQFTIEGHSLGVRMRVTVKHVPKE
jgi:hypothetical protein